jgi:ParB/RepB/Spo0J family partition protein
LEQIEHIPVDKLREPARPIRTMFDEEALEQLARSIRDNGILQPLRVRPLEDGTFEVRVGHRRLLASRMVGRLEVPCIVEGNAATVHAERIAENADREEMSAPDEARLYRQLFDDLGHDVDRVCEVVNRSRARVEGRLLLLQGDDQVLKALEGGEITLGVAEELNAFKRAEGREFHLGFAIRTGATRAQVREWRVRDDAVFAQGIATAAAAVVSSGAVSDLSPAPPRETPYAAMAKPYAFSSSLEPRECVFCKRTDQEWRMFRVFVCAEDAQKYLAPLEQAPGT